MSHDRPSGRSTQQPPLLSSDLHTALPVACRAPVPLCVVFCLPPKGVFLSSLASVFVHLAMLLRNLVNAATMICDTAALAPTASLRMCACCPWLARLALLLLLVAVWMCSTPLSGVLFWGSMSNSSLLSTCSNVTLVLGYLVSCHTALWLLFCCGCWHTPRGCTCTQHSPSSQLSRCLVSCANFSSSGHRRCVSLLFCTPCSAEVAVASTGCTAVLCHRALSGCAVRWEAAASRMQECVARAGHIGRVEGQQVRVVVGQGVAFAHTSSSSAEAPAQSSAVC